MAVRALSTRLVTVEPACTERAPKRSSAEEPAWTGVDVGSLRLSRAGEEVAFHVEPTTKWFSPGSTLYFMSAGAAANPCGRPGRLPGDRRLPEILTIYHLLGDPALKVLASPPSAIVR